MKQLDRWMVGGKISKLVLVITSKETGEHVERWQFDVQIFGKQKSSRKGSGGGGGGAGGSGNGSSADKENAAPEYACMHANPPPEKSPGNTRKADKGPTQGRKPSPSLLHPTPTPSSPPKIRHGNPIRDPSHLPADHRVGDLPTHARRRLHLQRARVRRRRLRRADRVGRQRRQGDPERGEGAATELFDGEPSGRYVG